MLHLLYLITFTILAFLAVGNLIRSLFRISLESQQMDSFSNQLQGTAIMKHPEMLDESGNLINEPLLVMRSISVEDARERLDAIYKSSPGTSSESNDQI